MTLPHEGLVPTLPGRSNTGEAYIRVDRSNPTPRYCVFTGGRQPGRMGPTRFFPTTPEGFANAIAYRDAVLSGKPTIVPELPFFRAWASTLRDDSNDPGPRRHKRAPSTVKGTHRATRPNLPGRFEWKATNDPAYIAEHVGRMLARRWAGLSEWVLVMPDPEPDAVAFALTHRVGVTSPRGYAAWYAAVESTDGERTYVRA